MKRYVLISVLMAVLFQATAFCQEPAKAKPQKKAEHQMHLRRAQLELEEREMELNFRRQMQEIKVKKAKMALGQKGSAQKYKDIGHFKHSHKCGKVLLLICVVVHILLGIWVYKDIRSRNAGSGIWIVVVLLAGVFGVIPYAIVRLGDIRKAES